MGRATSPPLNPYEDLIVALLRQAVHDARRGRGDERPAAQAFLQDREQLTVWVELLGADVETIQPLLLQAAGLRVAKPD
jgi:hypothetical protein